MTKRSLRDQPGRYIRPRGLRREEAANYVGVSPTTFDTMIKRGDMPDGFRYGGIRLWDINDLDICFDLLKAEATAVVPTW